jgi:hypothetical protein
MNVTEEAGGALVPPISLVYRPPAMKSFTVFSAVLAGLLLLGSCGDDGRPAGTAGNDSTLVGASCMSATECDKRLCQTGTRFPGGVCTMSCGGSGGCPSGSSCALLEIGWVCLVNCTETAECREQWVCEVVPEAGTGGAMCTENANCGDTQVCVAEACRGTVSVCIGPAPAP